LVANRASDGGGGLAIQTGTATLIGADVVSNQAGVEGGGIHVTAGTVFLKGHVTIRGNTVTTAGSRGGGLSAINSFLVLESVTFLGNSASGVGGGCWLSESTSTLDDCIFSGNSATAGSNMMVYRRDGTMADVGCSSMIKVIRSAFDDSGTASSLVLVGAVQLLNSTFTGTGSVTLVKPLSIDVASSEFGISVPILASEAGGRVIRVRNSRFLATSPAVVTSSLIVLTGSVKCGSSSGETAGCDKRAQCTNNPSGFGVQCVCLSSFDLSDRSEFGDGSTCDQSSRAKIFVRTQSVTHTSVRAHACTRARACTHAHTHRSRWRSGSLKTLRVHLRSLGRAIPQWTLSPAP
jgi:hypothetical protein